MKRTITITNQALQYLYTLVWFIKAKDIDSVRKINRIYSSIEPTVIEYEKKWQEIFNEWKKVAWMFKFAKEQHENTLNGDGYKTSEDQKTAEEKLSQGEKDIEAFNKQLQEHDAQKVEIDFEAEAFAFLKIQLEVVLVNYKSEDGQEWINGRKDLILIEAIFDAFENVAK